MQMPIFSLLFLRLRKFARDDTASITVETLLILPILLWAFLATFSFFNVYRAKGLALKASYSVSDLLSRQTDPVNAAFIEGIKEVFEYLTPGSNSAWMRVTVLRCHRRCDAADRQLKRDWSYATAGHSVVSDNDLRRKYSDVIPVLASGERLIMVETGSTYDPMFSPYLTGLGVQTTNELVLTRPRFAPQLLWES
jgi:hypothetical protein